MSSAGGSFSHISLHIGSDSTVRCNRYPDHTPILTLDAGDSAVSISVANREATEAAVAFARALARQAEAFADEVQRLHAANAAAPETEPAERAA